MLDLDRASEDFRSFAQSLTSRGTDWVTARDDAQRTRALCEGWIREYRPRLVAELGEVNSVIEIDGLVNWLRSRCGVKTRSEAMRASLQAIARLLDRELLPAYDTATWSSASAATSSPEQLPLLARLNGVSPAIADSYQQACIDLADDDRRTYVGPAGELREVLRGTIDQLSPDDDEIRTQPWFKGYQGKPTQAERNSSDTR